MSSFKILTEDILALIYHYLAKIGVEDFAQKLQKVLDLNLKDSHSPLAKKNLKKMIKFYVKNNEKLQEEFINFRTQQAKQEEDGNGEDEQEKEQVQKNGEEIEQQQQIENVQEETETVEKKKKKKKKNSEQKVEVKIPTSKKVNEDEIETPKLRETEKKTNKKRKSQQIFEEQTENNENLIEKQQQTIKKQQIQKKIIQQEADENNNTINNAIENDNSNEEKEVIQKKMFVETKASKKYRESDNNDNNLEVEAKTTERKFFQRCNDNNWQSLKSELKDNTFSAKFKFGRGDQFGIEGYNRLANKQGKDFKKEKGKLKNKAFFSGSIDINAINSVKL